MFDFKNVAERSLLVEMYDVEERGLICFDKEGLDLMEFRGSLREVYHRVLKGLKYDGLENSLDLFLFAPRLIRGIIDIGIDEKKDVLDIKLNLEDIVLDIYAGERERALNKLKSLELDRFQQYYFFSEDPDNISWKSFNPTDNENLILHIQDHIERTNNQFDYLVMDGHDAYRSGYGVAAAIDAIPIALRNSLDSGRDVKPRPLIGEKDYLRRELYSQKVLLFAEDCSTGSALASLKKFIYQISDPKEIKTAATIKIGEPFKIKLDYFGKTTSSFS